MSTQLKYQLIVDVMKQAIDAGHLQHGTQVSPDDQLMVTFGVSRGTVTKAMDILARDGYVDRIQGKGTFVAKSAKEEVAPVTFETRKLDKFADNIIHYKTQYLSAIMEAVYVRADYLIDQKERGHDIPDYGKVFAMEYLISELIHRQIFPAWDADNSDPRRMQAKYVLKQLINYVEENPRSRD